MIGTLRDMAVAAGGIAIGVLVASPAAYLFGKSDERAGLVVEATTKAISKIQTMEENNEAFRDLTPHHRCLVLMRDSKLPDSACD
ncbi:hypothetical protein [Agrobacterium sp.]|uniref:hypothetical protein n=1 Tax=Agrobacterium sp. TaxID=361 RepID=UPI0028A7A602|nr:hypothetical protein [Agrobacterium sp.]